MRRESVTRGRRPAGGAGRGAVVCVWEGDPRQRAPDAGKSRVGGAGPTRRGPERLWPLACWGTRPVTACELGGAAQIRSGDAGGVR